MPMPEEQLRSLPDPIRELYQRLERDSVDRICNRINKIGKLSASDMYELKRLSEIGGDVDAIKSDIADILKLSEQAVYDIYYTAAKTDYEFQRSTFDKLGLPWVPFDENPQMLEIVRSASAVTAASFVNMSSTTGFVGDISGAKPVLDAWKPLAKYYQDTVDYAVFQIRTGVEDYNSVMRQTVRELSDNGLTHIEYDNENKRYYRRRLDSSVRVAVSGGLQRLHRTYMDAIGEMIGADGREISWHSGARPSHVDFAGRQFNMKDYEEICVPLLEDYNCYHRAFPIVLGISEPAHSDKELAELNKQDQEPRPFEGRTYTMHEATQKQRQLETAIRRQKDRAIAFGKAGISDDEKIALAKAAALSDKYKQFSRAMGIDVKNTRVTVAGFTRSQAARLGVITRNRNAIANLSGITTANGIVTKSTTHIADQAVKRGVSAKSIQEALTNPINIGNIKTGSDSRHSQRFVGNNATVSINPDSGALVTAWKTGNSARKKYGGD